MRKTLENATGLSIDYQIAFNDSALKDLVDEVFTGVEVDVPRTFEAAPIYVNGDKYPAYEFQRGMQRLDGLGVLQFIKSVPSSEATELEHNARKHLVFKGLSRSFREEKGNIRFWLRITGYLKNRITDKQVEADFDVISFAAQNMGSVIWGLGRGSKQEEEEDLLEIDDTVYIVDSRHGDGGVGWATATNPNPIIAAEARRGIYRMAFEVPTGGNPYAVDLANGYWFSVRNLVKRKIVD